MKLHCANTYFLTMILVGLVTMCFATPALATVHARLQRSKIYEGDSVSLVIESDGPKSVEPDLSPLGKDFTVLGTGTSNQVSIINGRRTDRTSWTVQLEPQHLGRLTIPPIRVGADQTPALELEVAKVPEQVSAQLAGHLFLEVQADSKGPVYVQQQIPYVARLYYDETVIDGSMKVPRPENSIVEQLGDDRRYAVTRNGRRYNVIERHLAISPEKSGSFLIPPTTFKGKVSSPHRPPDRPSPRDELMHRFFGNSPFANDPFFSNGPFANPGRPVRIHSQPIDIDVQPRPAAAGKNWLPAEKILLTDSWVDEPPQLRTGEPVTRTITLQAKGLTGSQLPELQLAEPANTRVYPDAPAIESRSDGDQVYGISRQSFTYIPGSTGALTVPKVELSWWNLQTNRAETARLPKWDLNVLPGSGNATVPQPPNTASQPAKPETGTAPRDTEPAAVESPPSQVLAAWPWLAAAAALVLVVILAGTIWRRRQPVLPDTQAVPGAVKKAPPIDQFKIKQQLQMACEANDAIAAAKALLALGKAHWPQQPPGNLEALAVRWRQAAGELRNLDRQLYAADAPDWNGAALWELARGGLPAEQAFKRDANNDLDPLYPQSVQ